MCPRGALGPPMGPMGFGAHGLWGPWALGPMGFGAPPWGPGAPGSLGGVVTERRGAKSAPQYKINAPRSIRNQSEIQKYQSETRMISKNVIKQHIKIMMIPNML